MKSKIEKQLLKSVIGMRRQPLNYITGYFTEQFLKCQAADLCLRFLNKTTHVKIVFDFMCLHISLDILVHMEGKEVTYKAIYIIKNWGIREISQSFCFRSNWLV